MDLLNEVSLVKVLRGVRPILLIIFLSFAFTQLQAQTWNEWFKQKKTQRRYLTKQIALLRVYLGYLKEGYEIADKGLTTIHNIKNGDFNLHRDFFGSLKAVNPVIAKSEKIADILAMQAEIVSTIKRVNKFCSDNEFFTPEEVRYMTSVCTNMVHLSDVSVSTLMTIIQPNEMEMKDDERLAEINKLYEDVIDKQAFVQSFENGVRFVAGEREREARAIETRKNLLGI